MDGCMDGWMERNSLKERKEEIKIEERCGLGVG